MTASTITFKEHYNQHKAMLFKMANSFNLPNDQRDDLMQCGRIGIHRAMQTYKEDGGSTMTTWIYTYAKKEMVDYVNQNYRTIRLPVSQLRLEEREQFPTEFITSLDTSIYDDGEPLYSTIAYEEDDYTETNTKPLKNAIMQLKPQYQVIMNMLSEGHTMVEIGKHLGVTKEAVRQKKEKALAKLREIMVK
jgi:RNA polymerase sigma factor (sigma-70 family)